MSDLPRRKAKSGDILHSGSHFFEVTVINGGTWHRAITPLPYRVLGAQYYVAEDTNTGAYIMTRNTYDKLKQDKKGA